MLKLRFLYKKNTCFLLKNNAASRSLFFHKLIRWEYWDYRLVYIPIYFYWIYLSIRAKSFFFFNAANPTIRHGGFAMESKYEIYEQIPTQYYPKTLLFRSKADIESVLAAIEKKGIYFPCIAKPDIGLRGMGVSLIKNQNELNVYVQQASFDFLIQEFIDYDCEAGIFYYRYPSQPRGYISGIVLKEFVIVEGDGMNTVRSLVEKNPRYQMQMAQLVQTQAFQLERVLGKGEQLNLVPFGNHARGSKFIDGSDWINARLETLLNEICAQIPSFYFGRLDIKFNNRAELEEGKNFSIIELNGAGSEPTHIYDPKHSLFFAWRELARHLKIMNEISIENHRKGIAYMTYREVRQMLKSHREQLQILQQLFD